jgi:hypothetical protein
LQLTKPAVGKPPRPSKEEEMAPQDDS